MHLEDYKQRCTYNPGSHLRWSFLQKLLIIFTESCILDVSQSSEYVSAVGYGLAKLLMETLQIDPDFLYADVEQ